MVWDVVEWLRWDMERLEILEGLDYLVVIAVGKL